MLPLIIDPKFVKVLVSGKGFATSKRLKMLKDAGVENVKYIETAPQESDFDNVNIAYIADFDVETSGNIAAIARAKNILLNIEDKKQFCDFHVPSITRKQDLMITVSTAGKSPRVARRLRMMFDSLFSDKWGDEINKIGEMRESWKAEGDTYKELSEKTDERLESSGIMNDFCDKCRKSSLL